MATLALLRRGPLTLPVARCCLVATVYRPTTTSVSLRQQEEGYMARNKRLGRPLSPHLKILATNPDPVWILSFGHRFSGMAGTAAITLAVLTWLPSGRTFTEEMQLYLGGVASHPMLWTSCKFMIVLPFAYHFFNGLRHLSWDTGRGFQIKTVIRAGYTVLTLAILTSLGLAFYTPAK